MKKAARKSSKAATDGFGMSKRFDILDQKLNRIIVAVTAMPPPREFEEVRNNVRETKEIVRSLMTSMDKLTKTVTDLLLEYHVMKQQLERYDRWFKEIAEKVGIELKP